MIPINGKPFTYWLNKMNFMSLDYKNSQLNKKFEDYAIDK